MAAYGRWDAETPKPAALETTPKPPPVKKPAARPAAVPESPVAAPEEDEVVLPTEGRSGSLRIPVTVEGTKERRRHP